MDKIKSALMTYSTYNKTQHSVPYFFKIERNGQYLYYFGANHSRDPKDKQYAQIKIYWNEFIRIAKPKNSLVAVEGGIRNVEKSENEAIEVGSEASFITYLAKIKGYDTFCPEPSRIIETEHLLSKYSKEEMQYYYFARVVHQWGRIPAKLNFENYVMPFLQRDKIESGWSTFDFSLENMKEIHKLLFKGNFNERHTDFFYSTINPCFRTTAINSFSQDMGIIRDAFIVNKILEQWKKGKNLFIVFGHTHTVMQEPALKKLA